MADAFLASLPCPALTKSNYVTWAIRMKVYLQAHGLWDAVDAAGPVDPPADRLALAAIHRGISSDTLLTIVGKETAREAWQALRTLRLGTEPAMRARAEALARELEAVRMKDPEPVDGFAARVAALVVHIRAHGGEVQESYVVRKILRAASPKFFQIALAVEAVCHLESMTVEDLVGRLKAYEIRLHDRGLMTHAEWEAMMKKRGEEGGFKGHGGRGHRGHGGGCGDPGKKGRKFDKSKVRCYNCRDYGHFALECRKPKK
jgi:hypothetical protein